MADSEEGAAEYPASGSARSRAAQADEIAAQALITAQVFKGIPVFVISAYGSDWVD